MADRLLGLVGAGKGPVLRTARMQQPQLCISGSSGEWTVCVETDTQTFTFSQLGKYILHRTDWLSIQAEGDCRGLICTIQEA